MAEKKLTYEKYLNQYNGLDEYLKNKIDWLESKKYSLNTKNTYMSIFVSKIFPLETAYKRDLYTFSQYEIEEVIKNISTISIKTALSMFSIIKSYIQWTVDIGKNIRGENPCNKIIVNNIIRLNTVALKELYMTRKEFYEYIYSLEGSEVDKCIIMLLRYGLSMNELTDLKWDNIDKDNLFIYTEHINYPIDELLIDCLNRCKECKEYETLSKNNKLRVTKYVDSEYVCKQTQMERGGVDKVNIASLHTRIKNFFSNNGLQKINVRAMRTMPVFDMMYEIYKENGKVTNENAHKCLEIYSENKEKQAVWNKLTPIKETFKIIFDIDIVRK